jgi:hypothetical protein
MPKQLKPKQQMPKQPVCKIKGDAGTYEIWAIDWLNQKYLVSRSGENEWMPASKVTLIEQKED